MTTTWGPWVVVLLLWVSALSGNRCGSCLEGVRLAERWLADVQVLIETDCATVVEKVNNPATDRSIIAPIISDIKIEASRR
jgi:hypothetical protein